MINPDSLTDSPNEQDAIRNLNAILDWVTSQRIKIAQFPAAQPLIEDFERWYGALEERYDKETLLTTNPIGVAEVNEAKRKRAEIQATLGEHADPTNPQIQTAPGLAPPEENIVTDVAAGIGGLLKLAAAGVVLYVITKLASRD